MTDTLGRQTQFDYDNANRVTRQTLPDSQVIAFDYDDNGNLTSVAPPGRDPHLFDYSPIDQMGLYSAPYIGIPTDVTYTYDDDHRLIQVVRPDEHAIELDYQAASDRLERVTIPRGSIEYAYVPVNTSGAGLIESIESPDGIALDYTYDGPLPLSERWSGPVAGRVDLTYDTTELAGLTATSSQDYNSLGELEDLSYAWASSGAFAQSLTRDALGRITSRTEHSHRVRRRPVLRTALPTTT